MLRKLSFSLAMAAALCVNTFGVDLTFMTEEYPPFNYTVDGKLTGFSTEIVEELKKRTGYENAVIEVLPWSRAYSLIQKKEGMVLYSMTRSQAREALFKWVGPLVPNRSVLWGQADREYTIKKLEDAKEMKIGAYKDDAGEQFLKEQGFPNVESVIKDELNARKLAQGKIDLWIAGDPGGLITAKAEGLGDKVKRVLVARETQMYIAFSKETPDAEIAKWQQALDDLKAGGFYQKVWDKYFK